MIKRGFVDFACERNRVSVFTLWCIRERERERERRGGGAFSPLVRSNS